MKEALRFTFYANRLTCTLVLRCDRVIRKDNQTIKITNQLIDGNQIKRRIRNLKDLRGKEGRGRVEPIPLAMV